MTRIEGIQQLLDVRSKGLKILDHLEASAGTAEDADALQVLATTVTRPSREGTDIKHIC